MGAISGMTNLAGTAITAEANQKIARDQNKLNYYMFREEQKYNKEMYQQQLGDQWAFYNDAKQNQWDMWNATNEYNSASAQRDRLQAAGLNPYVMMSGGNAGSASAISGTSGSAPSAMSAKAPGAVGYPVDFSHIGDAFGQMLDDYNNYATMKSERGVKDATAQQLRIQNKYEGVKILTGISKMIADTKDTDQRVRLQKIQESFMGDLLRSDLMNKQEDVRYKRAQTQLTITQDLLANTNLSFLDDRNKLELANSAADLAIKAQTENLTKKQIEHEVQKIAETQARTSLTAQQWATEAARTSNEQLETTRRVQENTFNADTYKYRVKTIRETLWNIMHDGDSAGIIKGISRFVRPLVDF